jgi:ribosomal protein L29
MKYTDIAKKNQSELEELVMTTREELRAERFKDRFAKKASIIRQAKLTIARALTEMKARTRQGDTK